MRIDSMPQDWRDQVESQLRRWLVSFPDCQCHALIDGTQVPSLRSRIVRSGLACATVFAGLGMMEEDGLSLSPLVVPYSEDQRIPWFNMIAELDGLPAITLLISPEPLDALAERLVPWCRVEAAEQPLLLRFADSRILPELLTQLDDQQRQAFLGPTRMLASIDRNGEWRPLAVDPSDSPAAERVVLNECQCSRLVAAAEADETLAQIEVIAPHLIAQQRPSKAYQLVDAALEEATRNGIVQAAERSSYCMAALQSPA